MDQATGKRAGAGGVVAAGDRLSALPDALLHSIMSLLTARQAVQTCVLSPRWRDLWRTTPCLDIDYREFEVAAGAAAGGGGVASRVSPDPDQETWGKVEDFTANLLMYHRAPVLDRFRLRVGSRFRELDVERWVRRAITCRPAVLEVAMASDYFSSLLLLDIDFQLKLPPLGRACRLKRLHLCGVLLDGGFAASLRSGCPVLEDLELKNCNCRFQEIVSATLKSLAIDNSKQGFDNPRAVTAPALASLRLAFPNCTRPGAFLVNGAGSLLHASIHEDVGWVNKDLFMLLGSLCNAKLQDEEKEKFPKFHSLTTLLMGRCNMSRQFDRLRFFLENIPSLETVTLKHCTYSERRTKVAVREISPRCQKLVSFKSEDLKLIEIKYEDDNTSDLIELLMSIRMKLDENTVILTKV